MNSKWLNCTEALVIAGDSAVMTQTITSLEYAMYHFLSLLYIHKVLRELFCASKHA